METIKVFDTTLRDGEQSPGAAMTLEQKYELAVQLARLGVDVIEAGFPVSSPHQFDSCRIVAERVKDVTVAVLARAVEKDLDSAAEAVSAAAHPRIHTFIATSPLHMKHKLGKDPDTVVEMAVKAVTYARNKVAEVEFSPEDATRSELPFLCRVIEKAIDAGATIINIPDTVGYALPEEFGRFITAIKEGVPNIDKAIISVHCHNDLGLGVANTLAGVKGGARQVEVTLNGIGERAGNAALEEFVMALYVRKDLMPFTTGIVTSQLYSASKLLAGIIGFPIPRNKPIIGENAFAHESGIHQDGVLKKRETYEIMTPESVGREMSKIVLGRHSGLHGFKTRLSELGFTLTEEELKQAYDRFLVVADRKKEVYDDDLFVILSEQLNKGTEAFILDYFSIQSGNTAVPTAAVRLKIDQQLIEEAATGDGPVDAIFKAIDRVTGLKTKLTEYTVQAVTPEKAAMGEVSVSVRIEDRIYIGRGASTDILEASAKAYINALNRYNNVTAVKKKKGSG
ncbi:MAG TPA: 2-isopropylmalate synthase [Spirochaetia bacterium]|nr:2-isopropylmalate synthase [Spirochaetia bacterium]